MAEPLAVVADCDSQGNIDAWFPNAAPHQKAKALSNALNLPLNKVRVRKIAQGGPLAVGPTFFRASSSPASWPSGPGDPASWFTPARRTPWHPQGHSMITHIKTGVDKTGQVLARDITCYMDGGAYSSTGPIATSVPFLCMEQTYKLPNVRYKRLPDLHQQAGPGHDPGSRPGVRLRVDSQLDKMAEQLGLDPVEVRIKNSRETGERTPTDSVVQSCGLGECITSAVEAIGWSEKYGKLPKWRGLGLGTNSVQTGFPLGIRGGSQAFIKFNEDGGATVHLRGGGQRPGQTT